MQQKSSEYLKYLDPVLLARISGLELRARLIVEGFFSGMHRSPYRGLSIEFADHRSYTQGDDIRHIDWKVYGKTDKYYIKQYEQETNLDLLCLVDCSESMAYRSSPKLLTKYEYAATLASSITYLALKQHDSVGVGLFDQTLSTFVRPSNSSHQWRVIVRELDGQAGQAKTAIGDVLGALAERLGHRTLVIVISDLFSDTESTIRGLRLLRHRGHDVIVWNLWDPAELSLPFRGPTRFVGLEKQGELLTDPRSLRATYLEAVRAFQAELQAGCGHIQVDYDVYDTSSSLGSALAAYLSTRSARLRHRSARVLRT